MTDGMPTASHPVFFSRKNFFSEVQGRIRSPRADKRLRHSPLRLAKTTRQTIAMVHGAHPSTEMVWIMADGATAYRRYALAHSP
jgi:hypothetical protein